jgi:glycerol-3-phosphate acyltransferase PlsY
MSFGPAAITAFLVAYLVGSLPFGLIVARLAAGIDIRKHGSGNIGATNVARVLGPKYGATVLGLDGIKGAVPTGLLPMVLLAADSTQGVHLAVLSGTAAILGHMFPCWIGFRGGKGVATALGVAVVLAWEASAVALVVFLVCFALTRIVSLSSITAACAFCALELWNLRPTPFAEPTWSLALFSTVVPILIVGRHRTNLARLFRGTEPRFRFGRPKDAPGEKIETEAKGEDKEPSSDVQAIDATAGPRLDEPRDLVF